MPKHEEGAPNRPSPSSPALPTRGRSTNYQFIDSQDPTTRSQIQRHTAQHAVQQRRHAAQERLRSEGSRRLEWQRRDTEDGSQANMSGTRTPPPSETSDQEIDSSRSVSEARLSGPPPKSPQTRGEQAVDTDGGMTMVYTTSEEALLKYYLSTRCTKKSHKYYFETLVGNVRPDPPSAYLVMAYAAAHRAASRPPEDRGKDIAISVECKGRCISGVNARVAGINQASSNENIRAVLFLVAFELRYGNQQEAHIHLDGLRKMVASRGGLIAFDDNHSIGLHLRWAEVTGTAFMVLDCGLDCTQIAAPIPPNIKTMTTMTMTSTADAIAPMSNNMISTSTEPAATAGVPQYFTVTEVRGDDIPRICSIFIEQLRTFRSNAHIQIVRQVLSPGSALYQLCTSVILTSRDMTSSQLPERVMYDMNDEQALDATQRLSWLQLSAQCKLACLLYINVCIATSDSAKDADDLLHDVLDQFRRDYDTSASHTGGSLFGLLWTFTYSLTPSLEANATVMHIVQDMMRSARRLNSTVWGTVTNALEQLLLGLIPVDEISLKLDEEEITRAIFAGLSLPR